MDFTVLENTQGSSLYARHEEAERKDKMAEREESNRKKGSQGRGLEPDTIRLSIVRNLSEAVHLF